MFCGVNGLLRLLADGRSLEVHWGTRQQPKRPIFWIQPWAPAKRQPNGHSTRLRRPMFTEYFDPTQTLTK